METPEVGAIIDGYRFNGGNPADPASWEQVSGPEAAGFTPLGGGWWRGPDGATYQEGRGGAMVQRSAAPEAPSGSGSSGGSTPLVGADARARFMINLGPLVEAQGTLDRMEREGYTLGQDWGARVAEGIPFDNGFAARVVGGPDYNAYQQASATFEAAILPIMSGAAVTPSEAERQIRAALPQMGDSPEVLAQKARQRQMMINAVAQGIGQELPYPEIGIWGQDAASAEEPQAGQEMAAPGPQQATPDDGLPTLPGFGGGDGYSPPGSENNPYDYDNLTNDQRQSLPVGAHIARRNRDGTYRLGQFVQAGYTEDVPEGAIQTGEGQFEVRRNRALGEAAAFASGAAEQLPFGDELAAGIVGTLTGAGYDEIRDFDRQQDVIDRAIFGGARNAGGVVGAGLSLGMPSFQRGGNVLGNLRRTVAEGAGYGALYGAGAADDGERVQGAVTGGVLGGVGAPVVQGAVRGAAALAEPVLNPLARVGGNIVRGLRGEQPITAVDQTIGRMAQSAPGPIRGAADEISSYGGTPVFADTLGREGQGLARAAATRGQTGRDVAADFARGRRADIQNFTAGLGESISPTPPRSVAEISEDLAEQQRRLSAEAFGPVRGEPVRLTPDATVALRSPRGRQALSEAADLYASSPDAADRNLAAQLRRMNDDLLDNPAGVELPVEAVDLLARYLNRYGSTDNERRVFGRLGGIVRQAARDQYPAYDRAVSDFAERAQLEDAAEVGARAIGQRGSTRDFVRAAESSTPDQINLMREAARGAFEQEAGTPAGAVRLLDRFDVGRDQGQRINALVDPLAAIDLQRGAGLGYRMAQTAAEVNPGSGSRSALNFFDDENLQQGARAAGALGSLASGNIGGAVRGAIDFMRGRGFSQADADEITSLALDPNRLNEAIAIADRVMGRGRGRRFVRNQIIPRLTGQTAGQLQDSE